MNKNFQKKAEHLSEDSFEARVKRARILAGLSQEKLAEKALLDTRTISRYESRKSKPSVPELVELCRALGVTSDYLIFGTESNDSAAIDSMLTNLLKQCPEAQKESLMTIVRAFVDSHR